VRYPREDLKPDRRKIRNDYLEDNIGMDITFSKRPCSCCGEVGWVPDHHRFLCVFCYVTHQNFDPHESEDQLMPSGWVRGDMPRMAVPRIGEPAEPDTYYTKEYSSLEMTQEELRMILAS